MASKIRLALRHSNQGQSIVEFALILPVLLFLVLLCVDFGNLLYQMNIVNEEARDGARAVVFSCDDSTLYKAVQQYEPTWNNAQLHQHVVMTEEPVNDFPDPDSQGSSSYNIPPSPFCGVQPMAVTVTVTKEIKFLSPMLSTFFSSCGSCTITGKARMYREVYDHVDSNGNAALDRALKLIR